MKQTIIVEVDGLPPAKSAAQSLLGAGHPHAQRVRNLLQAAQEKLGKTKASPILSGAVALKVLLTRTAPDAGGDATNYLGGIADVLQNKANAGVNMDHLHELRQTYAYADDGQIREVAYKENVGDKARYSVSIEEL